MSDDLRLGWVRRNRARKARERPVGDVLGSVARRTPPADTKRLQVLASTVAGIVDQDFARHCRISGHSNAALVVNVDEPSLVCPMRLRWLDILSGTLRKSGPGRAIRSIIFRYDRAGVVIRQ